jgi:hypothetical protein
LLCFSVFSAITLYKGITGAESCGCFGSIHVNPWITLFAIDLPAVIALAVFRPVLSFQRKAESIKALIHEFITPLPSMPQFAVTACLTLIALGVTTPVLAFNKPAGITSSYEVLEPETWVGRKLPILEHIDIAESLKKGNWLVLLYHHDCPDCVASIEDCLDLVYNFKVKRKQTIFRIAFISIPPHGDIPVGSSLACILGKIRPNKKWLVATPIVALVVDGNVKAVWSKSTLNWNDIFKIYLSKGKIRIKNDFSV